MKEILATLKKVGLTEKEISIYLNCLQYGKVTASTLARMTNIPRASIYDLASKMVKKGYVTTGSENSKGYYSAVSPSDIYVFLNAKKNDISQKVDSFRSIVADLEKLKTFTGIVPKIQYFEGKESLEQFFHHIAQAEYSYSIFSVDDLLKHIYFDIDELYSKLSHEKIKGAKRIVSYSETAKQYLEKQSNPNIQRKMLPPGYPIAAEITLYDGVLLQMSFGDVPTILEIKHPTYYQAQKTVFDYIRNTLP